MCDACKMVFNNETIEVSRLEHVCGREWPKYVNVYEVGQAYGGCQEGGWWFDTGTPLESVRVDNPTELEATIIKMGDRYEMNSNENWDISRKRGSTSCAGGYDICIRIEENFAEAFPQTKPTYE